MKKLHAYLLIAAFPCATALSAQTVLPPVTQDGLTVAQPKIYDTYYLQQQLNALKIQLEQLQAIDRTTLIGRYGNVQGASLRQTAVAVQASGPASPGVVTTTGDTNTVVSTTNSLAAANPSTSASSLTMPSPTLGPSDTFAEQIQLQGQIVNLQMLLDGAVSDRITSSGRARRSITLGFPISIEMPDQNNIGRRNNSVAEVKVSLCRSTLLPTGQDLSIQNLLPKEHTYNVAGLVDKSFSGSIGGTLGGVLSIGGGFLRSRKDYFVVQQQETVAFQTADSLCTGLPLPPPPPPPAVGTFNTWAGQTVNWHIRPVLNNKQVRPGMQTNFVQFSIDDDPLSAAVPPAQILMFACVQVGWRRIRNGGNVVEAPPGLVAPACFPITEYDSQNIVSSVEVANYAGGNLHVTARGTFQPGSSILIGDTILPSSRALIAPNAQSLEFSVAASDLAQGGGAWLVTRDNTRIAIHNPFGNPGDSRIGVPVVTATPVSNLLSLITITFAESIFARQPSPCTGVVTCDSRLEPWIVFAGNKVYGLADAPFLRNTLAVGPPNIRTIELELPTALVRSGQLALQRPFYNAAYASTSLPLPSGAAGVPSIDKVTVLSASGGMHLSLTGTSLGSLALIFPTGKGNTYVSPQAGFGRIDLTTETLDKLKQIVLCRVDGAGACDAAFQYIQIEVPSLDPPPAPSPSLTQGATAKVNDSAISVEGQLLEQFTTFEYAGTKLTSRIVATPSRHIVLDLPPSITTRPGSYNIIATTADGKSSRYEVSIAN
jgi:hypothetical protein